MKSRIVRGRGNPIKVVVRLKKKGREELANLLRAGKQSVRVFKRARVLQLMEQGLSTVDASAAAGVSRQTAINIAKRYHDGGLDRALYDAERARAKPKIGPKEENRLIAMVCSKPPDGFSRWTLRLIAREAASRGIVESISIEHTRSILRRHDLKPWREKNVVRKRTR